MDDGWLLFDGVFLRLPMVACASAFAAVLCAALLQFVALWRRQRLQIQSLRYGTISVASLLALTLCPCVLAVLLASPCSSSLQSLQPAQARVGSKRARRSKRPQKNHEIGRCLLVSYRPLASCQAASQIGLSTAQRRNGAPLTPSPRRLDVVAKANNAAVRPHKLEGLPESMLSRADVSYSGSHYSHNSTDHAKLTVTATATPRTSDLEHDQSSLAGTKSLQYAVLAPAFVRPAPSSQAVAAIARHDVVRARGCRRPRDGDAAGRALPRRGVRIVAISDTHNLHEDLQNVPDGDVLIHCGDGLRRGGDEEGVGRWGSGSRRSRTQSRS